MAASSDAETTNGSESFCRDATNSLKSQPKRTLSLANKSMALGNSNDDLVGAAASSSLGWVDLVDAVLSVVDAAVSGHRAMAWTSPSPTWCIVKTTECRRVSHKRTVPSSDPDARYDHDDVDASFSSCHAAKHKTGAV